MKLKNVINNENYFKIFLFYIEKTQLISCEYKYIQNFLFYIEKIKSFI
jgi:hypothetical protein